MTTQTTIDEVKAQFVMPGDLHRRFKACAAREGETMSDIVQGLVAAYLAEHDPQPTGRGRRRST